MKTSTKLIVALAFLLSATAGSLAASKKHLYDYVAPPSSSTSDPGSGYIGPGMNQG